MNRLTYLQFLAICTRDLAYCLRTHDFTNWYPVRLARRWRDKILRRPGLRDAPWFIWYT